VKAVLEILDQQRGLFSQMSYPDFESSVLKVSPAARIMDIKAIYNKMHKNDGKQVTIRETDKEMDKAQLQFWAMDAIQNPKNFNDFRKAFKIIKPQATEDEMKLTWAKYKP
jgi:t-SNARE complex subunit (syntaxin)